MRYEIRFAPRAAAQIREASDWWLENRPAAPEALVEELEGAIELIRSMPHAGQPYSDPEALGVRRVPLRRVGYHLYYASLEDEWLVVVLALWHSARGERPPLSRT